MFKSNISRCCLLLLMLLSTSNIKSQQIIEKINPGNKILKEANAFLSTEIGRAHV